METTLFQYCQKIVLFNSTKSAVLLAKRKNEVDYNGVYSFIGGKLETTDESIVNGLRREKNEELGQGLKVSLNPHVSCNMYYVKENGIHMILPHYYAEFVSGNVQLNNNEYSDYNWVDLTNLSSFEPKIDTIEPVIQQILTLEPLFNKKDFVLI